MKKGNLPKKVVDKKIKEAKNISVKETLKYLEKEAPEFLKMVKSVASAKVKNYPIIKPKK
jgi:ribosomal protein L5